MRVIFSLILVTLLIGCGKSASDDNYSRMFQTGVFNTEAAPSQLSKVTWTYSADHPITSKPLVTNDTAFVITNQTVAAVDIKSGDERWIFNTSGIPSEPVSIGKHLIIADDEYVYGLNPNSGKVAWRYEFKFKANAGQEKQYQHRILDFNASSVIVKDQLGLTALDAGTGKELWKIDDGTPISSATIVNDTLYLAVDTELWKVEAATGNIIDQNSLFTDYGPPVPMMSYGEILIGRFPFGKVVAYNLKEQETIWESQSNEKDWADHRISVFNDVVLAIDTNSGTLGAIDLKAGKSNWKLQVGNQEVSKYSKATLTGPAIAGDYIYIGAYDGPDKQTTAPMYSNLVCIDRHTGKELWKYRVDEFIEQPPVVMDGTVYVVTQRNSLVALEQEGLSAQAALFSFIQMQENSRILTNRLSIC